MLISEQSLLSKNGSLVEKESEVPLSVKLPSLSRVKSKIKAEWESMSPKRELLKSLSDIK